MTKTIWSVFTLFLIMATLFSCTKSEDEKGPEEGVGVNGTIEKGPFLTGSKVTLYVLDQNLNQTGKNFKTETINDKGDFAFPKLELTSQYVELEISGYFFNEDTGKKSLSQINLNAITDLSSEDKVNVNILTHLEFKRVKKLMKSGKSFASAKKEAEKELLKVFYITKEFKNPEKISLTDGDDNATMLLAISSILLYNKSEADFSQFISRFGNEFEASGTITSKDILEELNEGQMGVDAKSVMEFLSSYYQEQGTNFEIGNIRKYIDGNGDGVLDAKDEEIDNGEPPFQDDIVKPAEVEKQAQETLGRAYGFAISYFREIIPLDAVRCKQVTISNLPNITSQSEVLEKAWGHAYSGMRQCNIVIQMLEEYVATPLAGFDAKPYINAARVLRSLIYLDMVQHWGGVPLLTKALGIFDDYEIPRSEKQTILSFIESEMRVVLPELPEKTSDNALVPSKTIARVILGNALLESSNYEQSNEELSTIVNNNSFSLLGKGDEVYQINNKEDIFSIKYTASGEDAKTAFEQAIRHNGDIHPIYRFTGVVLSYAVSAFKLKDEKIALEMINQVRVSLGEAKLTSLSRDAMPKEIANLWENAIGKDYGYFALLNQLGIAVSTLGIKQYETLYPIPWREVILNSAMVQNPGYM